MEEQLDLIRNHNEFIDQQMDLMEEVSKKYDRLVHGFYDDYVDVAEGYTDLLSELSEEYSRKSFRETVGGFVLLGTGMTSAGLYAGRMNTSLVDLYTNPGNYSQDPEIFFWTAGVPLAGLYLFKRAYDHQQKADRYEEKINEVEDDLIS